MKNILRIVIKYYLKFLTKIILWRKKPLIVAVAGTTNKTFVKKIILEELKNKNDARGNPKSFDSEIGLPLAVLFLPSGYSSVFRWADVLLTGTQISFFSRKFPEILVLEMAVEKKGDMKYLLSIIKPKIAIVTNINQNFPDISLDVFDQEMNELVNAIPQDGLVILNGDDRRLKRMNSAKNSKIIKIGHGQNCQARTDNIREEESGQSFELDFGKQKERILIDCYGEHNIYAWAIAKVAIKEIEKMINNKK